MIVSNYHVVAGAAQVRVTAQRGVTYDVQSVAGHDFDQDLVVLSVGGYGHSVLPFASWNTLRLGAEIVAIGNPRGLSSTVSEGIISSLRTEQSRWRVQFTAPISPGSSGGALLDLYGRVIGVTTSYVENGQNLNFAVPTDYVLRTISAGRGHRYTLADLERLAATNDDDERAQWTAENLRIHTERIFDMTYLAGWKVEESEEWSGAVYHRSVLFAPPYAHRSLVSGYLSEGVRVSFQIAQVGHYWTQPVHEWAQGRIQDLLDANPGFIVVERSNEVMAGMEATSCAMVGQNSNIPEPEKTTFYFAGEDTWRLTIEVVSPASRLSQNEAIFKAIANTIRVLDTRPPGNGLPPK